MKKVLLITEYINPPYDEGIKKTVYQLFDNLKNRYDIKVICRYGPDNFSNYFKIKTNKLFLSFQLKKEINLFSPDVIIYFPFASSTFASFIRHFVLSNYKRSAKSILLAMQPKPIKWWQKIFILLIKPKIVLTPSPLLQNMLNNLNIKNELLPLFTDLNKFKPIENTNEKLILRKKYGINSNAFVISHMGHLNEGRNLKSIIRLQKAGNQVVVVASSSTPIDSRGPSSIREELEESGIIIIDRYIENIQEIYQLSDCYVFPVIEPNSSIGLPLSILEARACGVPVITTDYGSVNKFLGDDFGGIFYSNPDSFLDKISIIKEMDKKSFCKTGVGNLNSIFINNISNVIEG
ncbi:MAG TPA: glycosyltransferase family 4 protein [Ignavibacteriales bacterium]|nr:glycosyltransferase family 4 protein [Ignavibacteriales bacterium]